MNNLDLVSIIIPTKNSALFLADCLASIKNQTYNNIELIVVDNHSSDRTVEIAKKFTQEVFVQGPERSAQRNFGAKKSKGNFVVFIDSDMVLSPEVIAEAVEQMQDAEVGGVVIPEKSFGKGFWSKCKILERDFYQNISWVEAARFFRKEDFLNYGGYDENLVSGEDWDLSTGVLQGRAVKRTKDLIYHNEGRLKLRTLLRKKFYYGKKFRQYLKKNHADPSIGKQTSFYHRFKLFFTQPKIIFEKPVVFSGMLLMKFLEFVFGYSGYLVVKHITQSDSSQKDQAFKRYPFISIIIPVYNAEKQLAVCLESIAKQKYPKDKLEIIICDGGSTDQTLNIARQFNCRVINNEKKIAEYGKALGVKESRGEYFVLIDSDNELVGENWLSTMAKPILVHNDLFGVESALIADKKLSRLNRYFARMRIADPLAKLLVLRKIKKIDHHDYKIPLIPRKSVVITGANGFLWNKKMVLESDFWKEKFEEANFGTHLHNVLGANYAISKTAFTRHYYCKGLLDYFKKRKKIALKIRKRLENRESVWVNLSSKIKMAFCIFYLASFVGPLFEATYRAAKDRTLDWFWHPVISFATISIYGIYFIKSPSSSFFAKLFCKRDKTQLKIQEK